MNRDHCSPIGSIQFGQLKNLDPFSIYLYKSGWLVEGHVAMKVNGEPYLQLTNAATYIEICRKWQIRETLHIDFTMDVLYLKSHPLGVENIGRFALTREPLVYSH